jgi:hypothetical protein
MPLLYLAHFIFWWRDREMKTLHFWVVVAISVFIGLPISINPIYMVYDGLTHTQRFLGVVCTKDCSGHKAGYAWAEANSDEDTDACENPTKSFQEGCEIYFKELAGPSE